MKKSLEFNYNKGNSPKQKRSAVHLFETLGAYFYTLSLIHVFILCALTLSENLFLESLFSYVYLVSYLTHYKYFYRILISIFFLFPIRILLFWAIEIRQSWHMYAHDFEDFLILASSRFMLPLLIAVYFYAWFYFRWVDITPFCL